MLKDSTRANNPLLLGIRFYTRCANHSFWIDDLTVTETSPSSEPAVDILGAEGAVISNQKLSQDASLAVEANNPQNSISKTYFNFGNDAYENVQLATLDMKLSSTQKHTLNLFAFPDFSYPERLTYQNAPANIAGAGLDLNMVYGNAPLKSFAVNGSGLYTIDVTDYIKNAGGDYVFALTSDDIFEKEYLNLDFETYTFTKDVDYQNYGDFSGNVSIDSGACVISGLAHGNGIRILNAFGNEIPAESGAMYKLTADISAVGDGVSHSISIGVAGDDGSPEQITDYQLTPGEKTAISYIFQTGTEDGTSFTNLVFADTSDVPAGSIVLDNIVLLSGATTVEEAVLNVAVAKETVLPDYQVGEFVFYAGNTKLNAMDRTVNTIKIDVHNNTIEKFEPRMIVALYEGSILKKVYFNQPTTPVTEGNTALLLCENIDLSDTSVNMVKVMLWENLNGMKPMKNHLEVSL